MPFRSESQRRYLWANEPQIAQRWTREHGSKPVKVPNQAAIKRRLDKDQSGPPGAKRMRPIPKRETNPVPSRTARGLGPRSSDIRSGKSVIPGRKRPATEKGMGGLDDKLKRAVKRRLMGI